MSRVRGDSGIYSITSPGISERVNTSAPTLGAALSKSQTIASKLQREMKAAGEEDVSLYVRKIGESDLLARIDVHADVIATYSLAS